MRRAGEEAGPTEREYHGAEESKEAAPPSTASLKAERSLFAASSRRKVCSDSGGDKGGGFRAAASMNDGEEGSGDGFRGPRHIDGRRKVKSFRNWVCDQINEEAGVFSCFCRRNDGIK